MKKPTIQNIPTSQEIAALESEGYVFETHDSKKIVARAKNSGVEIIWLEDGTEVIRDLETGQFLDEWPEDA